LHNGAQPTETAKAIFLTKGFIETSPWWWYPKGLTQEQADAKLATWLEAKLEQLMLKKEVWLKLADAKAKAFKAEQDETQNV
jgi:small subunit ribosomal protein S16